MFPRFFESRVLPFALEGLNSQNRILGVNIALGLPNDQISLQSELVGCYRVVRMVQALCEEVQLCKGQLRWDVIILKPYVELLNLDI